MKKYEYRINENGIPGIYNTQQEGYIFLWDMKDKEELIKYLLDFLNTRAEAIVVQEELIETQEAKIKELQGTLEICIRKYQGLKEKMFRKKLAKVEADPAYWAGVEEAYEKQLHDQADELAKVKADLLLAQAKINELMDHEGN